VDPGAFQNPSTDWNLAAGEKLQEQAWLISATLLIFSHLQRELEQ